MEKIISEAAELIATRIEIVVYNLSLNEKEYYKTIAIMMKGAKLDFCPMLTPNNTELVSEIAKKYIVMPQVFKNGDNYQEILANSSIPVLKALEGLQNNTLDVMSENKIGVKKVLYELNKNTVLKDIINRKQTRYSQEAYAIITGKINPKPI